MPAKLRMGICGVGSRGTLSFGALLGKRDDAEIVALCDTNTFRMHQAAITLGCQPAEYTDLDTMLAKEALDGLVITTPDHCHANQTIAALRANVNVLIDKPLATTAMDCKRIIEAQGASTSIAMMGFNLRQVNVLIRLKAMIDEGAIGRVFLIENREFYDGGRTYMARWNRKYASSGGLWVHKGSHDFDVFNWLLGFPKPVRVSATAGVNVFTREHVPFEIKSGTDIGPTCAACAYADICPDVCRHPAPEWSQDAQALDGYAKDMCLYTSDKDVHDNGIAIVEYENGARASHLECFSTSLSDRLYTVVGDRGQIEVSLEQRTLTVRPRWSQETTTFRISEEAGGHGGSDPRLLAAFIDTIHGTRKVESTLEQGLWSTAIGDAAERAWREARTVTIAEVLGEAEG